VIDARYSDTMDTRRRRLHPDGTLEGAHDPRADGGAAGCERRNASRSQSFLKSVLKSAVKFASWQSKNFWERILGWGYRTRSAK